MREREERRREEKEKEEERNVMIICENFDDILE